VRHAHVTIDLVMTATATPPAGAAPGPTPGQGAGRPIRRAVRDTESPVLGGVAAGLARHLGLPVLWVRVAFVVTACLHGLGGILYLALWLMLPADPGLEMSTPGAESASRGGRRPRRIRRLADAGPAIALAALALGGVLVVEAIFGQGFVLVPIALGVAGVTLLWRQADETQRERWLDTTGRIDPARVVFGSGGWASYARVAAGVVLVFVSLGFFALRGGSWGMARDLTIAGLLGVVGLVVVIGPWIHRLATDLTAERAERVRTQERADVAAHLHDSVLQTLALIQKNSSDGQTVARLARAQERDLRAWLYAGESASADTVAAALRSAAAEVEDSHGVAVDVVVVGDRPFSEAARPVVAAAREAIVNAAKHARVDRVDVYAEITPALVEVFVRDRGVGFDPAAVADDRHGVAHSIVDRMTRHGGSADVRSTPGEGTEVRLSLPLEETHD
jgi:signal transduction histidine kinase/phage shock protein PspC (stress-responsive transcriptional regulator)